MINYILISLAVLLITVISVYFWKKKNKKNKFIETIVSEDQIISEFGASATEIVKEFLWHIYNEESLFNRTERRRILRHYKKFVWDWPDLTRKQQDITRIVGYLANEKRNKFVLQGYKDITTGSLKEGE